MQQQLLTRLIRLSFVGLAIATSVGAVNPAPAIGQSTLDLATLRSRALSQHNTYRAMHHAPALTSSDALNSSAQSWANHLAATGTFAHSRTTGVGENLYVSYSTAPAVDTDTLAQQAVTAWYDEVTVYNYAAPGFSGDTGHFTQVVWRGSTQLGCGAAEGPATINGTRYQARYVVCQYTPPGNVMGQFPENVRQP